MEEKFEFPDSSGEEGSERVEMPIIIEAHVQGTAQAVTDSLKSLNSSQMTVPLLDPTKRFEELKETIANELNKGSTPNIMKRIDTILRCGVSHHFEDQINEILCIYEVPRRGREFQESINEDMEGLISLYEAAHLGVNNEEIMSQALDYSKEQLKKSMNGCLKSIYHMLKEAENALELPRHMRMVRLEAKKFITDCISKNDVLDSNLFEFAAMDFNSVQSLHQSEIAEIQKWWKTLELVENLRFARDRPLECFLWTAGMFPEPCYSKCRIEVAKAVAILLVIDDVYDSYGSLEDLTNTLHRCHSKGNEGLGRFNEYHGLYFQEWDVKCYMALYNTINEIAYSILKEYGWCVIPRLQRTTNGVRGLSWATVTLGNVGLIESYPKIFACSGRILRLWDDLGTSKEEQERGDVALSIECYMREKSMDCSDEDARAHIKQLIHRQETP
ncbi:putative terpene synthase 11 [Acorus calamus]|uniref:Terpene synthase 11 n=1 Tax=Acorus calamus TaxID=4465 RepID=A0AAV9DX11_ACOCL|nr:putative terpene synthase 11 [Acorus calamus]